MVLLAAFAGCGACLFHALTAQDVGHAVVAFVTGVFIQLSRNLRHRHDRSDPVSEGRGVVQGPFVVHGIRIYAIELLDEKLVFRITEHRVALSKAIKIARFYHQSIALPITS